MPIAWHIEDPELLREAIGFTAATTGFQPALVEKDYFASVVLEWLASRRPELVFKGGTALSKVHSGFFRLSEDLDFRTKRLLGNFPQAYSHLALIETAMNISQGETSHERLSAILEAEEF